MRLLTDLWFRVRAALRPASMERQLDEEFAFHLEMEARKLTQAGMPPNEAAREAERRFGGPVRPRQMARDSWGTGLFRDAVTDVRHAFRQFRRRPMHSALGLLTLGLGLAATIGLFGVIRSLLLRPLPIRDEAAVRVFWSEYDWRGVEFDFLKERRRGFDALAAYSSEAATLRDDRGSSVLLKAVTSAEFFDVLGTPAFMGRTFRPGEDRPGAEPVVVVSHGMWQTELGADPGVIGRRIALDGRPVTVVGVMPRGFFFPTPEHRMWSPVLLDPSTDNYQGNGWLVLFGRVTAGTSEEQLAGHVAAMASSLGERFTYSAAWDKTRNAQVRSARDYLVGNVRPVLLLLFGAGVLLLTMACANVAALVLSRTADRGQEMTLRVSLGAGRARLVRQIIAESLTFSLMAGLVGVVIARAGLGVLVASLPLPDGLGATVAMDWTAFAVALTLAAVLGLVVAIAPSRALLMGNVQGVSGARGSAASGGATRRVHQSLVGLEAALAVLLMAGALLLVRSVAGLLAVDLGFDPKHVAAVDVSMIGDDFTRVQRHQLFEDVHARVSSLPGVISAGWTNRLPIRDGGWQGPVSVDGVPELQGAQAPNALFRQVSTEYLTTMGIRVVRGRDLEATDREGAPRVALVNQAFADRAWPGLDPLGRRLRLGVTGDTVTVVGVTQEVRSSTVTGAHPFVTWVPDAQYGNDYKTLVVKSSGPNTGLQGAIRRITREVDPRIAVNRPTTMDQVVSGALSQPLQLRFFLSLFGALALTLGMVGIYSVASYSVSRRRAEIGVRMALGASPGEVLRQVVLQAVAPVALGTVVGLMGAVVLARGASQFLYGVSAADPVSLGLAGGALLVAGAVAAMVPAFRASRVSPVESLGSP